MRAAPQTSPGPTRVATFATYVAIVLTIAMALFPPFTSVNGTEYAFVATGPEWARQLGAMGEGLGVGARIHWAALSVQLAALWAIALGARWYFGAGGGAFRRLPDPAGRRARAGMIGDPH